jgi:hypothetical protein
MSGHCLYLLFECEQGHKWKFALKITVPESGLARTTRYTFWQDDEGEGEDWKHEGEDCDGDDEEDCDELWSGTLIADTISLLDALKEELRFNVMNFALEAYQKMKNHRAYALDEQGKVALGALARAMFIRRDEEGRSHMDAKPTTWQEFFGIIEHLAAAGANVLQKRPGDPPPHWGKSSLTISAKPAGVWAMSQPWIAKVERSGLQTHTATTESVSLCTPMKS